MRNSLVTQWVKGLASLLWCEFDPWPRNFCMPGHSPKKKKKKKIIRIKAVKVKVSLNPAWMLVPEEGPDLRFTLSLF